MYSRHLIPFRLNKAQAYVLTVMAHQIWLLWSRGTGKTVGVTAPWILHKVYIMPRSCGFLVGLSFADLKSKILKPLFEAFGKMGHVLDKHYTFGKEPPKTWKRPYTPIIDWTYVIAFPNGTVIQLISLHMEGSANSNSFQWGCGPEAKYFKQTQLRTEVFPTLRGHVDKFGNNPYYGSTLFESDKYGANIHWLLEKKQLHDETKVSTVLWYQLEVNRLRMMLPTVEERQSYRIIKKIEAYTEILNALRRDLVFFSEASAYDNIANLTPGYIENMRRDMTEYEFEVSIENKDPTKVEDGFYPDRNEDHLYNIDNDDDVTRPLAVAMDWQASITPLVSCQLSDKVEGARTLNFLHSIYSKAGNGIDEVIRIFCDIHKHRPCKKVIFFYDHTAVAERVNALSYYKEAERAFLANGWEFKGVYLGQTDLHDVKYNFINKMLRGQGEYGIRFHMERCKTLLLSMDNTEIKKGTAFKKDKSKEKDKDFPQELATHFPDTFDVLVMGIMYKQLYPEHYTEDTVPVGVF